MARTAPTNAFSRRRPTCDVLTALEFRLDRNPGALRSTVDSNTGRGTPSFDEATNVQGTSWIFFAPRVEFIGCMLPHEVLACSREKGISAITHYAKVDRIEPYGDQGKYKLNFSGPE